MNTNEYVRLNPDISVLILCLLRPADHTSETAAALGPPRLLEPDPECHVCISEAD